MAILWDQDFSTALLTAAWEVDGPPISCVAADQSFNDTSESGAFTQAQVGDSFHDGGRETDGSVLDQDKDFSFWTIVTKPTNNKITVVNQKDTAYTLNNSPTGYRHLYSGMGQPEMESVFMPQGVNGTKGSAPFARVVADSQNVGKKVLEVRIPKLKATSGSSGMDQRLNLSEIIGEHSELFLSAWLRFLPGTTVCTLNETLTAGNTTSLSMTLQSGDLADFAINKNMPFGSPTDAWAGSNAKEWADVYVVGDPNGVFECIGVQSRTSTTPSTTASTLARGLYGSTIRDWLASTPVRAAYMLSNNKVFGLMSKGAASSPIAMCMPGYVNRDYQNGVPRRIMTPTAYRYTQSTMQYNARNFVGIVDGLTRYYAPSRWYHIKQRVKMNTPGVADGILQVWMDDALVVDLSNMQWRDDGVTLPGYWSHFRLGSHPSTNDGALDMAAQKDERMQYDKITIADTDVDFYSLGRVTGVAVTPAADFTFAEGTGTTTTDSVNGLVGTLSGGTAWGTGGDGSSLVFDGVDDIVTVPHSSALEFTSAITIKATVKIDVLHGTPAGYVVGKGFGQSVSNPFALGVFQGQLYIIINNTGYFTGYVPTVGVFTDYRVTYDGADLKAYVGVNTLVYSASLNLGALIQNTNRLIIGARNENGTSALRFLDGEISRLQLLDYVELPPGDETLTGSISIASASANLTTEGTNDWAHYGHNGAVTVNSKVGGTSIGTLIATTAILTTQAASGRHSVTWSDGTPTVNVTDSRWLYYVNSQNNGFTIPVAVGVALKTIKVYLTAWDANGRLTASISDSSSPDYVVNITRIASTSRDAVITIDVAAASAGQTLTLTYINTTATGNVGISAITESSANEPPIASNVLITGHNGGIAYIGDVLTGTYSYSDSENDSEGVSIFRWLRDGAAISGATGINYTITTNDVADPAKVITFEVTPVAQTGTVTGSPVTSSGVQVFNNTPVSYNQSILVSYETQYTGTLTATDADGHALTYSIETNGAKGTAAITNASTGEFTYTPNAGQSGADSFTFYAADNYVGSISATVTVDIVMETGNAYAINSGIKSGLNSGMISNGS